MEEGREKEEGEGSEKEHGHSSSRTMSYLYIADDRRGMNKAVVESGWRADRGVFFFPGTVAAKEKKV